MKIALIGYGKMGKSIERIAINRGHEICLKISTHNLEDFTSEHLKQADVAIEFTRPESAFQNVSKCLHAGIPVISGTTGWNEQLLEIKKMAAQMRVGFIQASNFSIGVNIFFEINTLLSKMMKHYPDYDVQVEETHHTQKLDAPSGTAITVAEQILENLDRKKVWVKESSNHADELSIKSYREEAVPGTHVVKYTSSIDDIEIKHIAHNRDGFATGAVLAAEFIFGKKDVFTMKDVLFNS